MKRELELTVNGEAVSATVDTRDTLLDLLRDRLGLTGTKEGCGNGNCGACTVLVNGAPVNACIVFACDTEPVVVTDAPGGRVVLYPRRIDLDNSERLRGFEATTVVANPAELAAALRARIAEWEGACSASSS